MTRRDAENLLARMRRTLTGWGQRDFTTLYKGFGFDIDDDGPHTVYIHSVHTDLRATVGRHNQLAKGYASHAIKTIDKLLIREAEKKEE